MRSRLTYRILKAFLLSLLLLPAGKGAFAQIDRSLFRSDLMYDTLTAIDNKEFLYNSITLTNNTNQQISIMMSVNPPPGWSSVSQKITTLSLNAYENTIIPVRLKPNAGASSRFQNVVIEYRVNNSVEPVIDTFGVRLQAFTKFRATLLNGTMILAAYQKEISFPVYVKNTGNIPDVYKIRYTNDLLQVDDHTTVHLEPGKDTTYHIRLRISESQWSYLKRQDVKVMVSSQTGETINLSEDVSRIGSMLKDNNTAYLDMPIQFEGGAQYMGEQNGQPNVQYYGGVSGYVDLTDHDRAAFIFRSNTYAPGQVINNSIIRAEYAGKHMYGVAGNIMEVTDFFMDGMGGKVGFRWSENERIQAYAMLKSRTGDSKLFGLDFSKKVRPGMLSTTSGVANFDFIRKLNSYVARQSLDFVFDGNRGKLNLSGAAGMDQTSIPLFNNAPQQLTGTSYGYNLQWNSKKFSVQSNILNYSNSFPGIYKGQRTQIHELRTFIKSTFAGVYYEYNYRRQNFFLDTALYSDVFNLRTSNYGARAGFNIKHNNIVLSAGRQEQEQALDVATPMKFLYDYLQANITLVFSENLYFTTNSYFGYGSLAGQPDTRTFINSNQASLAYKHGGITMRYDKGPYYYHEFISYVNTGADYERIILSPYAEAHLLKKNLNLRAQVNYSKTSPDMSEIANLMGNVSYTSPTRSFEVNLSGITPLSKQNATPYISLSFRVRMHTPFVPVRKYYNMKLVLFRDRNGNNEADEGEEPISNQTLAINGILFVTDEHGVAQYRNIAAGDYKIDLGYSSRVKGIIPVGGALQTINISKNTTVNIPYKTSKVIQGKLTVDLDANSNLSFSTANIKVSATTGQDTSMVYSTLTDENGEFSLNVPSGIYTVSLSPAAFDDNFKPSSFSQIADLVNNEEKTLYYEIRQKKRQINIKKK